MNSYIHKLGQSLIKNKKKFALYTLGYFGIGYIVATGMWLYSHPEYLYYGKIYKLIRDTTMNDQFWLAVLLWPLALYSYIKVKGGFKLWD